MQATGERTDSLEVEHEYAETTAGEQFSFYLEGRQTFKGATGYKTRAYFEYLQEFLLSRKKAEIIGERAQPIVLTTKKIDFKTDGPGPQGFAFEYSHATASLSRISNRFWELSSLSAKNARQAILALSSPR